MQVAALHGDGNDDASEEHDGRLLHIHDADLVGGEDAQQREGEHRDEGSDGQRDGFRHPVGTHDKDDVTTSRFLQPQRAGLLLPFMNK